MKALPKWGMMLITLASLALYIGLATTFICEAYGLHLSFARLLTILGAALLASKGVANVPAGSLVALSSVLLALGLPADALALVAGVDVFLDLPAGKPDEIGRRLQQVATDLELAAILNRGTKVWPGGAPETFCTDHWRCRFFAKTAGGNVTHGQVLALLQRVADAGFDFIKTENLYNFDGKPGFS